MKASRNSPPTRNSAARVLIVEDHPIVREGYFQLISQQADLEVCGEAAEESEALRQVKNLRPDLVVVDISLKEGSGIELIKQIRAQMPNVPMLAASAHDESLFAERVLHAGAMGYVNKQQATEQLIEAIRSVLRGDVYLSPEMTDRVLHRAVGMHEPQLNHSPIESLSDRELEVFELIGEGLATRQIAGKLHLSPKTVETYRENIKSKLNFHNATELTRHAVQWVLENR